MLSKLLKYDIQSKLKFLTVFYILALFFAILTRIFFNIENSFIMDIIAKICSGVTISMIFNILINNLMRLWVRFKNNLYGDEAYLTHTLPVKKESLYLSKILSAVISMFISVAVIGLTLFVAYYSKENIQFLKNMLLPIANAYDTSISAILISFLFVFFLQLLNAVQVGFTGIILGHRMNSSKLPFSVLFGFIAYMATQTLVLICVFAVALFNKDFMNLFITNEMVNIDILKTIIYMCIFIYSAIVIGIFFINTKLFKDGVNVD
ncbi:MAG: hypothetical protein E7480_00970 [Ruminococcaceae bacterium]|nr:hypothetical protein [Oscillospiraceae bacterium]